MLQVLKGVFFGHEDTEAAIYFFPLLPWFAVYVGGASIGEWLSRFDRVTRARAGKQLATRAGVVLCATVLLYGALRVVLSVFPPAGLMDMSARIRWLISPFHKDPPGLFYLLVFGSTALLVIGCAIWKMGELHTERNLGHFRYLRILEQVGKNSLPLFILQFVIYYLVFFLVVTRTQLVTPARAALFLLLSLLGIAALGGLCEHLRIHRAWTVGLPALTKRWPILTRSLLATAPADQLRILSGSGETYAEKMVKGRSYERNDELMQETLRPEATHEQIIYQNVVGLKSRE